jgi:hypothetical protein
MVVDGSGSKESRRNGKFLRLAFQVILDITIQ